MLPLPGLPAGSPATETLFAKLAQLVSLFRREHVLEVQALVNTRLHPRRVQGADLLDGAVNCRTVGLGSAQQLFQFKLFCFQVSPPADSALACLQTQLPEAAGGGWTALRSSLVGDAPSH